MCKFLFIILHTFSYRGSFVTRNGKIQNDINEKIEKESQFIKELLRNKMDKMFLLK